MSITYMAFIIFLLNSTNVGPAIQCSLSPAGLATPGSWLEMQNVRASQISIRIVTDSQVVCVQIKI